MNSSALICAKQAFLPGYDVLFATDVTPLTKEAALRQKQRCFNWVFEDLLQEECILMEMFLLNDSAGMCIVNWERTLLFRLMSEQ
jgi:hypothetical protein